MKVGFISPYLHSGTTHQRAVVPARYLEEKLGWECAVGDDICWMADGRVAVHKHPGHLICPPRCHHPEPGDEWIPDVLVVSWWSPTADPTDVLTAAKQAGQRIILDVDDNPIAARGFAAETWRAVLHAADLVWFSTVELWEQLHDRIGRRPSIVVPTLFEPAYYQWPRWPTWPFVRGEMWGGEEVLGYRGGMMWHSWDVDPLRHLNRHYPFVHFGHDPTKPSLADASGQPVLRTFNIHEYPHYARLFAHVAPWCTVGVIPLAGTRFTDAKTCIGGYEWSQAQVPWLASDQPAYRDLAGPELAPECLVRRPRDWPRMIGRLVADTALRADLAASQAKRVPLAAGGWMQWPDAIAEALDVLV